jgi:hypothetical protein
MVNGEWTFAVEDLGDAMFDFVEISEQDLEACGVLHIAPNILAALRVNRYEVYGGRVSALVELIFQSVSLAEREARTELEIECACDSVAFLRQIGDQVCHAYEKARVILSDDAG